MLFPDIDRNEFFIFLFVGDFEILPSFPMQKGYLSFSLITPWSADTDP